MAKQCRHYRVLAAPELGEGWLRCCDCGREYQADAPNRHQVHAKQERGAARDGPQRPAREGTGR